MSNNPQPVPTPVAGPTAQYSIPNIPANAYTLLSNLADAIDTTNTKLNGHASKLSDISGITDKAVNEVISYSQGQTTDTLSNIWQNTQTDLTTAHDQLSTITTYPGGLGSGNQSLGWDSDLKTVLDQNKAAIQTGLIAIENLQQQNSHPSTTATAQQLQQWQQDIYTLDNAMNNVNLAIEGMAMAISNLNNGFTATCATGFAPGMSLVLFSKKAFANQTGDGAPGNGNTPGSSGGDITVQQLEADIKLKGGSEETTAFLPLLAEDHGISLNNIKELLDTGVNPDQLYNWLFDDTQYKITDASLKDLTANVKLLVDRGGDATESATWLQGLDADQVASLKNRALGSPKLSAAGLKDLVDPQLEYDPNEKHDVIDPKVGPQPTFGQDALNNSVSIGDNTGRRIGVDPNTGELVVLDDTNNGLYHGHVRSWFQDKSTPDQPPLTDVMRNALQNAGIVDSKGRIILRNAQGQIIGYGKNVIKGK